LNRKKSEIFYHIGIIALTFISSYFSYRSKLNELLFVDYRIYTPELILRVVLALFIGVLLFKIASEASVFMKSTYVRAHLFFWIILLGLVNLLHFLSVTQVIQLPSFILGILVSILIYQTNMTFVFLTGFYSAILVSYYQTKLY